MFAHFSEETRCLFTPGDEDEGGWGRGEGRGGRVGVGREGVLRGGKDRIARLECEKIH